MTPARKVTLIVLGLLAAVLIVAQLVMGQLILSGRPDLIKAHQHSGYSAVVVCLVYIALSLITVANLPTRPKL
jgi:hypothetical protein